MNNLELVLKNENIDELKFHQIYFYVNRKHKS